jgi:hypothetical protein
MPKLPSVHPRSVIRAALIACLIPFAAGCFSTLAEGTARALSSRSHPFRQVVSLSAASVYRHNGRLVPFLRAVSEDNRTWDLRPSQYDWEWVPSTPDESSPSSVSQLALIINDRPIIGAVMWRIGISGVAIEDRIALPDLNSLVFLSLSVFHPADCPEAHDLRFQLFANGRLVPPAPGLPNPAVTSLPNYGRRDWIYYPAYIIAMCAAFPLDIATLPVQIPLILLGVPLPQPIV